MSFVEISLNKYIKLHLKNNPERSEGELRENLSRALKDFKSGVKCQCGNDIWVIGSSISGTGCFHCITGESDSSEDYEIKEALPKKYINRSEGLPKIMGYYDDEGNQYNPNLSSKPNLCLSCKKNNDSKEEIVCNLTRLDQLGEKEFICNAYEKE